MCMGEQAPDLPFFFHTLTHQYHPNNKTHRSIDPPPQHHNHHIPQPQDPKAFPCPDDGEVHSLWYMEDGKARPAKLHGYVFCFRWVCCCDLLRCALDCCWRVR